MRKVLLSLLLSALFFASVSAQKANDPPEYGKPEELKGLKSIYVHVEARLADYNDIIEELEKAKIPGLKIITSKTESAEMLLMFRSSAVDGGVYVHSSGRSATAVPLTYPRGDGMVSVITGPTNRVVFEYSSVRNFRWEDWPAKKFAKNFIKLYKKVNGLK